MSISSIVTRGYGAWSTVNGIPTLGYGIGSGSLPDNDCDVFGNVFDYQAGESVFGNVFDFCGDVSTDGWIAQSRSRVLISESRSRVLISESRNRVWIAKGKQ